METNLLKAINNILQNTNKDLFQEHAINKEILNRANNMGDVLEVFVKDSFCNTFNEKDIFIKQKEYTANFSWLGNQNNPPDIIIKNGDAIEVKKLNSLQPSDLVLNSSYPKSKLFSDNPMITVSCKNCETWNEKDIIYTIGCVNNTKLKIISFVYGDCFAANKDIYERIKEKVSNGLKEMSLELSKTKEIGRVNRVDPLGITNLRIRGMWTIQNPLKLFSNIFAVKTDNNNFNLIALMKKEKYRSFPTKDKELIENNKNIKISEVRIQNPNNPAKLMDAILIKAVL